MIICVFQKKTLSLHRLKPIIININMCMKTNLSKLWLLVALLLMAACGGSHRGGSDDLDEEDE